MDVAEMRNCVLNTLNIKAYSLAAERRRNARYANTLLGFVFELERVGEGSEEYALLVELADATNGWEDFFPPSLALFDAQALRLRGYGKPSLLKTLTAVRDYYFSMWEPRRLYDEAVREETERATEPYVEALREAESAERKALETKRLEAWRERSGTDEGYDEAVKRQATHGWTSSRARYEYSKMSPEVIRAGQEDLQRQLAERTAEIEETGMLHEHARFQAAVELGITVGDVVVFDLPKEEPSE